MALPTDVPSSFLGAPERMYLIDLKTSEVMTAQFNPAELNETLKVARAKLHPPGLPHERLQYSYTENHRVTFELIYDALSDPEASVEGNLDARNFLMSLCYPKQGVRSVNDGADTRVLFVWPNMISLTAVISELRFKHSRFARTGESTFFKVDVSIEEIRDGVPLTSEEVRKVGTLRVPDDLEIE